MLYRKQSSEIDGEVCSPYSIYGIGFWLVPVMLLMYSKAARLFEISGKVRKMRRTSSSLLAAADMN